MASLKATEVAPALPAGPVDFDKLSASLAAGKSGEEAIAAATKENPVPNEIQPAVVTPAIADEKE